VLRLQDLSARDRALTQPHYRQEEPMRIVLFVSLLFAACATDPDDVLETPAASSSEQSLESPAAPPGTCSDGQGHGYTCFNNDTCRFSVCGSNVGYCNRITSCCVCGVD
jgi:hypothetical protein